MGLLFWKAVGPGLPGGRLAHCWVLRQQDREEPLCGVLVRDFVSGFPAAPIMHVWPVGVVCGVCGVGLLFENYIVDASILYKKQFPRY